MSTEISALLKGAQAVLKYRKFEDAARAIFDSCKELIGAAAGYVALLSDKGDENEVLFLDAGGLPCTVDPSLPMPVRGLRGDAYRLEKTVYDNSFMESSWIQFMPQGHVRLENVLFAPLVIEGKAVGLIGLANKPGGFTQYDAEMASAFGEFAAVALVNSRILELLEASERRYHNLADNALVGIYQSNLKGDILYVNEALLKIYEFDTLEDFMAEGAAARYKNPADREVFISRLKETGRLRNYELEVITKRGHIRNVLLSATLEGDILSGMLVDVTEHRRVEEEIHRQKVFLQKTIESLAHPFYVIDVNDYTVVMANSASGFVVLPEKKTCYALTHRQDKPCSSTGCLCPLESVKETKRPVIVEHTHYDSKGNPLLIEVHGYPVLDDTGEVIQMIEYALDITERKKFEEEREKLVLELQEALARVKQLSGMLPICCYCKKIRDDKGYWEQIETYISKHSDALFSHGMCPACAEKALKEFKELKGI